MNHELRELVLKLDQKTCQSCGKYPASQVHHIKSRRQGGKDILSNLITLCGSCHMIISPVPYFALWNAFKIKKEKIKEEKNKIIHHINNIKEKRLLNINRTGNVMIETKQALEILKKLIYGINPINDSNLSDNNLYHNPQILRAFFTAYIALERDFKQVQKSNILPKNAGDPWTNKEETILVDEYKSGMSISDIAKTHNRTNGAISSRLKKLGILPK
jgi:hypothetical protein